MKTTLIITHPFLVFMAATTTALMAGLFCSYSWGRFTVSYKIRHLTD